MEYLSTKPITEEELISIVTSHPIWLVEELLKQVFEAKRKELTEMLLGYIRVSTEEQNEERQTRALLERGVEKENLYIDKQSGKNTNRPKLSEMLSKSSL